MLNRPSTSLSSIAKWSKYIKLGRKPDTIPSNREHQNAISSEQVVKVVKTDNPDFRYIVGKDAKSILEVRRNISDKELGTFMKGQFGI